MAIFDRLGHTSKTWSGTSTTIALTGVTVGSLLVVTVVLNDDDAGIASITDSQGAALTLVQEPTPLVEHHICFGYKIAANSGTHTFEITPNAEVNFYSATASAEESEAAGSTVVYDSDVGLLSEEVTGSRSESASDSITASGSPCLLYAAAKIEPTSAVLDSDWDTRNEFITTKDMHASLKQASATAIDYVSTHNVAASRATFGLIAFYEDAGTTKTVSDTGSGVDTVSPTASVPLGEIGSGIDTPGPDVALSVTESSVGIDILSLSNILTLITTGFGVDLPNPPTVTLLINDTSAGVDGVTVNVGAILKTVVDAAIGVDALLASASVPIDEVGTGIALALLTISVPLAESGVGADAVTVQQSIVKTVLEIAAGLDLPLVVPATVTVSTLSSGQFAAVVIANMSLADAMVGVDTPFVTLTVTISEALSGTDALTLATILVPITETASAIDILTSIVASLTVTDLATATDIVVRFTPGVIAAVSFTLATRTVTFTLTQRT